MTALLLTLTVVIDPGHGGSNTGAPTRRPGTYEKQVTLQIAKMLARTLRGEGVRVVLTREDDSFVAIRERARRANLAEPDCFISLHANASPNHSRHGVETYVLSREAAEVEARRAARAEPDALGGLLAEMKRLDAHRNAIDLAKLVQSHLTTFGSDRGVREAPHDVLAGLSAPAILVEVGFVDHPIEGPALARPDVQSGVAQAIADGIMEFSHAQRQKAGAIVARVDH